MLAWIVCILCAYSIHQPMLYLMMGKSVFLLNNCMLEYQDEESGFSSEAKMGWKLTLWIVCASLTTELGTPFVLQPANRTLAQTKQFEAGEEISYPFHLSIYPKLSSDGFRISRLNHVSRTFTRSILPSCLCSSGFQTSAAEKACYK